MTASANVERVRSIVGAWERGDFSSVDWAHPQIETVVVEGPSPGRWTGLAGMAEGWRGVVSAFDGYRVEGGEYRELDSERVLVSGITRRGRGKASGIDLGQITSKGAVLFHVRDRQVTKLVLYFDSERAVADLGLARSDNPAQ